MVYILILILIVISFGGYAAGECKGKKVRLGFCITLAIMVAFMMLATIEKLIEIRFMGEFVLLNLYFILPILLFAFLQFFLYEE